MEQPLDALPEFVNPPVSEVAMSVQFEPIEGYTNAHSGLLWKQYEGFPRMEEHAPLPRAASGSGSIEFTLTDKPRVRTWFINDEDTELVQVQQDRFARNWRKRGDREYPRYERVREGFLASWSVFKAFVERELQATPRVDRCELVYVNHIRADSFEANLEPHRVLNRLTPATGGFLPALQQWSWFSSYNFSHEVQDGELRIQAAPGWIEEERLPIVVLTLVARGVPSDGSDDALVRFFDSARQWIVKGFTEITTEEMHELWQMRLRQ